MDRKCENNMLCLLNKILLPLVSCHTWNMEEKKIKRNSFSWFGFCGRCKSKASLKCKFNLSFIMNKNIKQQKKLNQQHQQQQKCSNETLIS